MEKIITDFSKSEAIEKFNQALENRSSERDVQRWAMTCRNAILKETDEYTGS